MDKANNSYNQGILFNRACALIKLNDKEAALKDLNSAIDLNDEYAKAIAKRAELYMLQENYEEAVRDLEKVKQIDPSKLPLPALSEISSICIFLTLCL